MPSFHVLCPEHPGDPVSARSRWIAQAHAEVLGSDALMVTGALCTERALATRPSPDQGTVFVGHGQPDHLPGSDHHPLFPGAAAARTAGRWFHAVACDAGWEVGPRLHKAGASPWVGYRGRLTPEWSEREFAPAFIPLATRAITSVSEALAGGAWSPHAVARPFMAALDQVEEWMYDHPDDAAAARFQEPLVGLKRYLVFLPPEPPG